MIKYTIYKYCVLFINSHFTLFIVYFKEWVFSTLMMPFCLLFFFYRFCFGVIPKKFLCNPGSQSLILKYLVRMLFFSFYIKVYYPFWVILLWCKTGADFLLYYVYINCPSTICWKAISLYWIVLEPLWGINLPQLWEFICGLSI